MLILGGAVIALFALLSLSGPGMGLGTPRLRHALVGAIGVTALIVLVTHAGPAVVALALLILVFSLSRPKSRPSSL